MKKLLFILLLLPTIAFSQVEAYHGTPWVHSTVDTNLLIKKSHAVNLPKTNVTVNPVDTMPLPTGYVLMKTTKKDRLQYVQTVTAKRQCLTGTGEVIDCLEIYTLFKVLDAQNGYAIGKLVKGASVITDLNLFKLETPLVFMYTSVKDDK